MSTLHGDSRRVIALALEKGATIGTAESLTGGMIAAALAGIPGASKVLMGGIVSYDPVVKRDMLGVSQEVLDGVGVVSGECAAQMAQGAKARLGADVVVSVTGLAGPGGGTAQTPVGTVFLGIVGRTELRVEQKRFYGRRQSIRKQTVKAALRMLLEELRNFE